MKKARIVLITIGLISIIMALFGLRYNLITVFTDFGNVEHNEKLLYFYPAFYTMSAICVLCYIGLLVCGVQFLRLDTRLHGIFTGILLFEVVYFFSIGATWLTPKISMSIGVATGVANGGLMCQFLVLFPLWAPLVVKWAKRKQDENLRGDA